MADVGGGSAETPEERLARIRQAALMAANDPSTGQAATGFEPPTKTGITLGTVDPSNPLGKGANPASLGAQPASSAVQQMTGTSPLSPAQQSSLGAAPLSTEAQKALGSATVNPATVAPGSISNVGPAQQQSPDQLAALAKWLASGGGQPSSGVATSDAPPPGFTGTFKGKQYSNGQPVSTGTPVPVTSGVGPTGGRTVIPSVPTPASPTPIPTPTTPISDAARTAMFSPGLGAPGVATASGESVGDGTGEGPGGPGGAGTGTENLGGAGGGLGQITQNLMSQLNDIQSQINNPSAPADVQLLYSQQLGSIMELISQQEQSLRAEAEKAGTTLDPATEFTLGKMREELDRQLKATQMTLNARGLYDSGILIAAESEMRKGNLSDQAQVMSTRLSKIQDELRAGLASLGQAKISVSTDFKKAGLAGQLQENQFQQGRTDNLQTQLLNARLGLRGQLGQEADAAASRAQSAQQASAALAQQRALALAQQQFDAAQNDLTRSATVQNQQNAQDAAAALQQARINAGEFAKTPSGGGGTDTVAAQRLAFDVAKYQADEANKASAAQNTPEYLTHIAAQELVTAHQTKEDALAAIEQQKPQLMADGVDPNYLINIANNMPSNNQGGGFKWPWE